MKRAKPKRPSSLATVDWGDVEHGINLLEAATTKDEREHLGAVLAATLVPMQAQAGALVLAVSRWAAWGGSFDNVRAELQALQRTFGPWAVVQHVEAERKAESAEKGAGGGHKGSQTRIAKAKARHEQWIRAYEAALEFSGTKWTPHAYAKVIAEVSGIDPTTGETKVKERTVRRALEAHEASQKVAGHEPPSRPKRPT